MNPTHSHRHTKSIALLRRLRDWPRPKVPHAELIVLLAVDDAGPAGASSSEILAALDRGQGSDAKPVSNLVKAGLIEPRPSHTRKGANRYVLTSTGRVHIDEIFSQSVPA